MYVVPCLLMHKFVISFLAVFMIKACHLFSGYMNFSLYMFFRKRETGKKIHQDRKHVFLFFDIYIIWQLSILVHILKLKCGVNCNFFFWGGSFSPSCLFQVEVGFLFPLAPCT